MNKTNMTYRVIEQPERKNADRWAEPVREKTKHGFNVGEKVVLNGEGWTDEPAIVVDYDEAINRAKKDRGVLTLTSDRPYLLSVYVPRFPSTYFWWIAPRFAKKA